jgi:hypothetical protein
MALTVFDTATEPLQPCNAVEQVAVPAPAAGEKAAVTLKETDGGGADDRPERADVWNMIQAQQKPPPAAAYVHPLVRHSSSLLTQKSLEICTESLGSETGSDGFSDADGASERSSCPGSDDDGEREVAAQCARKPRAFPPPLPSLKRRTVMGGMEMRQHRANGRLVVQAVPVPSPTLFRAQRRGGRLLLSFADTAVSDENPGQVVEPDEQQVDERASYEEEDDEEVEIVDRGTVVEFKVSTQPQARNGTRVHCSALVINKFVGAEPATASRKINDAAVPQPHPPRRCTGSTTTAVSATAAPTTGNGEDDVVPGATLGDNKLLTTAANRRRGKEELMKHMSRCEQLSGKLFFWEPRIATSS